MERAGSAVAAPRPAHARPARTAVGSSWCAARATTAPTESVAARRLRARVWASTCSRCVGNRATSTSARAGALVRADLAIDAMFGTGFRGALEGDAALVARAFAETAIPTPRRRHPVGRRRHHGRSAGRGRARARDRDVRGAEARIAVRTRAQPVGRVHVVDIGIDAGSVPGAAALDVLELADLALPRRRPGTGTSGRRACS